MFRQRPSPRAFVVVSAVLLVVILAVLLGIRVTARTPSAEDRSLVQVRRATASPAAVPAPDVLVLSELAEPFCWGCSSNRDAPLEFQVDLDLLAPLGDGQGNAAAWFADFAPGGLRHAREGRGAYRERMIEVSIAGQTWNVLPADDPLLLEAEPWIDRARCSFYPDVWEIRGVETQLPDLLMMLTLARSWVARGKLAADDDAAVEDFRRAIRLGRLLRQDDVAVIQDLVAIASIRIGAEALYVFARDRDDAATMLLASLVMADKDAMRYVAARRITTFGRAFEVSRSEGEAPVLDLGDTALEAIVETTRRVAERRFKMEGLVALFAVKHLGTPEQRETALETLDSLAGSSDPLVADTARRFRDHSLGADELDAFIAAMSKGPGS
jgi:hypothetical protein